MMRNPITIVVGILIVAAVTYVGSGLYFGLFGHRGVAKNATALIEVYRAADPRLGAFCTNSFFQKLQFTAPIKWRRAEWRPSVTITSQVSVAAFRAKMADESFTYIFSDFRTVYSFKIYQRQRNDSVVETRGTIDAASGSFQMRSDIFISKVDDHWWSKLTNSGSWNIQFAFDKATNSSPVGDAQLVPTK